MAFILINPVTLNMYNKHELKTFLKENDFEQVFCSKDWISVVKTKYKNAIKSNSHATVADMRCTAAVSFSKEKTSCKNLVFPQIEPILIHCAREISDTYAQNGSVVITTPCHQLADYGNSLNLKNTRFVSWNNFAKKYKCPLKKVHLEESPIPPGFFSDVEKNVLSVTGKDLIQEAFESGNYKSARLVEMLFCSGGCNNGDGVL